MALELSYDDSHDVSFMVSFAAEKTWTHRHLDLPTLGVCTITCGAPAEGTGGGAHLGIDMSIVRSWPGGTHSYLFLDVLQDVMSWCDFWWFLMMFEYIVGKYL